MSMGSLRVQQTAWLAVGPRRPTVPECSVPDTIAMRHCMRSHPRVCAEPHALSTRVGSVIAQNTRCMSRVLGASYSGQEGGCGPHFSEAVFAGQARPARGMGLWHGG